jgi:3-dehydro-L-gulonate 2-dehydrogenase
VFGGFDLNGELTRDAAAIEASNRMLPIGFWKGAGLSLMLDLLAALLSGGNATHQITRDSLKEKGLSQVFLAFDPSLIDEGSENVKLVDQIISYVLGAQASGDENVRYPGQRTLEIRKQNLAEGIPVEPHIWKPIQELAAESRG